MVSRVSSVAARKYPLTAYVANGGSVDKSIETLHKCGKLRILNRESINGFYRAFGADYQAL
jgi:hypothetical protein